MAHRSRSGMSAFTVSFGGKADMLGTSLKRRECTKAITHPSQSRIRGGSERCCAITGCSVRDVLEAAHIHPYRGRERNKVANGLLLRADLHTLFDCGLIAIDAATMTVIVTPSLQNSEYAAF